MLTAAGARVYIWNRRTIAAACQLSILVLYSLYYNYVAEKVYYYYPYYSGRLSATHNTPHPNTGFGYSSNTGSSLAPLIRYAFIFSPYK